MILKDKRGEATHLLSKELVSIILVIAIALALVAIYYFKIMPAFR